MLNTGFMSTTALACVSGHDVRSVIARDETARSRERALSDLAAALPCAGQMQLADCRIWNVVTTPDFHPGKPVPVGVIADMTGGFMPHMVGNDVGCGMRMIALHGITADDLRPELDKHLRHVHFQGGRDIALTGRDRRAILHEGVPGLLESLGSADRKGLLASLDMKAAWRDADRMSDSGCFLTNGVDPDFSAMTDIADGHRHDAIFGTIGGGNHFVEFGMVERVEDGHFAQVAGIRGGTIVIVVHSGSLDFGQRVGTTVNQKLREARMPGDHRILNLKSMPELASRYLSGLANAANAAFVNRFLIGLSTIMAVERTIGRPVEHHLVYDAPHNMIWRDGDIFRHRKGACPAREQMPGSPYQWLGEPVILPGSMGDGSWLLRGRGDEAGLQSAAHGAGRRLSRQEARSQAVVPSRIRIVGPVDLESSALKARAEIRDDAMGRLKEEAPAAYRPIENVVDPMVEAGLVGRVARIKPLLTVKG